ncbi:MAG: hypothetical protein V2I33_13305 [Kangiellaceae bacterium]|jgi:hypothetical protein|nr:hypothetical protein [Kangiellaceae bacterium]
MASAIEKQCLEILKKINDVPLDDNREGHQLTILMAGIADVNKDMMRRAAEGARASIAEAHGELTSSKAQAEIAEPVAAPAEAKAESIDDVPDLDDFDSFDDELDMIEQTLIRSIGD